MKQLLCLILSLSLLLLVGCSDWGDDSVYDPIAELSEYYQTENRQETAYTLTTFTLPYFASETLDPITCSDGCQQTVGALLYEGLYALDEQFQPSPVLAKSAHYDADDMTYTIRLKSGVSFSDGTALTAYDVVSTMLRAAESTRYQSRFTNVESVTAEGDTVVFRLQSPSTVFLNLLDIPIVKSDTEANRIPCGTGAYTFVKDDSGTYLAPNTHWWKQASLPLDRIELISYNGGDAAKYAFVSQDIQLLCADLTGTSAVPADMPGTCTDANTATLQFLGFNCRSELLATASMRQAISLAIDRQSIVDAYLLGHGVAAQFPVHPASPLYPADLEQPYSREAVNNAMERAAAKTEGISRTLTLLVNEENSFKVSAAREIGRMLEQYDLYISVRVLPWETFIEELKAGNYDLYYGEITLTPDWNTYDLLGSYGRLNFGGFFGTNSDRYLTAYMTSSEEHRADTMHNYCQFLWNNMPLAPICFKSESVLTTSGAVDAITPTAANPFYGIENWTVHLSDAS